MEVIFATRNPRKTEEAKQVFAGSRVRLLTLDEVGIEGAALEEGATIEDNAHLKAKYAYDRSDKKRWVISDDTGLFLQWRFGDPGVNTAVWGGEHLSAAERMQYCLDQMKDAKDRSATFATVVEAIGPQGGSKTFTAAIYGSLLEAARVPALTTMPYAALFVPNGFDRSLAEMSIEEENAISHRGKAFREALAFFEELISLGA